MNELLDKIFVDFFEKIESNKKFKKAGTSFKPKSEEDTISQAFLQRLSNDLVIFFKRTNGFEAKWDFDRNRDLIGRMNVTALEYVLESWEEKLYFDGADERLKHFRPLDIFTAEACVGILVDGSGDETLYYHDFGDSTIYSLDVDFKSYFDLSIDTRCFLYWQEYLVELVHGNQGVEVLFKTGMKEVFPDFDLEAFTAKFESMRLSKRK